jgi:toxin ParE1/3/4
MIRVRLRAAARHDLIDRYVYLSEYAGAEVADRFLEAVETSFADLAAQPAMGAPQRLRTPELSEMRKWRVRGFETILIFYQLRPDDISIVRVLHAAQDWWDLLEIEN